MTVGQLQSIVALRRHSSHVFNQWRAGNKSVEQQPGWVHLWGILVVFSLVLTFAPGALAQNTGPDNNPPVLDRAPESTKVGNNGSGAFSIPIVAVPPGTAAIAPALSLVYNSQSQQNQLLGVG